MDEFVSKEMLYIISGIIFLLILKKRRPSKEAKKLIQQKYQEIKERWNKGQTGNLEKAMKIYPSKHLSDKDRRWEEMIEKQREYAQQEDTLYAKQLQKEYGLTEKEWEKIKSQIFIENARELQKNPEFRRALKNIKEDQ